MCACVCVCVWHFIWHVSVRPCMKWRKRHSILAQCLVTTVKTLNTLPVLLVVRCFRARTKKNVCFFIAFLPSPLHVCGGVASTYGIGIVPAMDEGKDEQRNMSSEREDQRPCLTAPTPKKAMECRVRRAAGERIDCLVSGQAELHTFRRILRPGPTGRPVRPVRSNNVSLFTCHLPYLGWQRLFCCCCVIVSCTFLLFA